MKFSNAVGYVEFTGDDWLSFGRSLYSAGQTRYASVLIALYFTVYGVRKFYSPENLDFIDVPKTIELLRELSELDSFSMVRQAIVDLFEMHETIPSLYRGSLREFLPAKKATLTVIQPKEGGRLSRYKKDLIDTYPAVARLSETCQDFLVRGYALAKDPQLSDLSRDAATNYVRAIENELRSRSPDIDSALAEELQHFRIDVNWVPREGKPGRRGIFGGVHGICKMLEHFEKLSETAQGKLSEFRLLATHSAINKFLSSMWLLIPIRNSVQHADPDSVSSGKSTKILVQLEQLLFGEGDIIRVLSDTRQ